MAAAEPQHRVLVVNDDGYDAPGLHALVAALASLPGVAVFVAAPSAERSATGHGITIHAPLVAAPVHIPHAREAFAVTGLPADCTMMALGPLFAGVRCGGERERRVHARCVLRRHSVLHCHGSVDRLAHALRL